MLPFFSRCRVFSVVRVFGLEDCSPWAEYWSIQGRILVCFGPNTGVCKAEYSSISTRILLQYRCRGLGRWVFRPWCWGMIGRMAIAL